MKERAIIFGLDGVLADDSHRRPADGREMHWREQYDQRIIEEDRPIRHMIRICKQLGETSPLVIVTERPIAVLEVTARWLNQHGIEFDMLYTKQDPKKCLPSETKLKLIHRAIKDKCNPWLVVDCDSSVIDEINGYRSIQGLLVAS